MEEGHGHKEANRGADGTHGAEQAGDQAESNASAEQRQEAARRWREQWSSQDAAGGDEEFAQPTFPPPRMLLAGEEPAEGWDAIDAVTVEECIANPCWMHDDIPAQFLTAYCRVRRDIYAFLLSAYMAQDPLQLERALK